MSISIVAPPDAVEHDGPPDFWSGLARCPSAAVVTPLKQRRSFYDGHRNSCYSRKLFFLIGVLFCLLVVLVLYIKRHEIYGLGKGQKAGLPSGNMPRNVTEKSKGWHEWLQKLDLAKQKAQKEPQFEKFIFTEPMEGPMGNQMYRFASLYAIGQLLNRTPAFAHNDMAMKLLEAELEETFPHFHKQIYYMKTDFEDFEQYSLAKDCCDYHDPKKLLAHNDAPGLQLTGGPEFQNYHYFHQIRPQIIRLFEFNPEMVRKVAAKKKKMLAGDKMHKLCVHSRVGDLNGLGELKTFELAAAIERVLHQMLPKFKKKPTAKYSVLLFGEGQGFEESIRISNSTLNKVYHVVEAELNEGEELAFALLACDSLLLSESLSPYAFWMGYLMPEDRPIIYVRNQIKLGSTKVDSLELLPSDWLAIEKEWLKKKVEN